MGNEPGAGTVLGGQVRQDRVHRHRHRRGVQRDVFDDAGRQAIGEGAVDHAHQFVVDRDRCARVTRSAANLVDDGARLLARTPGHTAGVTRRPSQFAGHVAERGIRTESVDGETTPVGHRLPLAGPNLMTA